VIHYLFWNIITKNAIWCQIKMRIISVSFYFIKKLKKNKSLLRYIRERKRTEANWTKTVRFGSVSTRTDILKNESNRTEPEPAFWKFSRTEPNSNRHFKNSIEPNRTRTHFLKVQPNRTAFLKIQPNRTRTGKVRFDSLSEIYEVNKSFNTYVTDIFDRYRHLFLSINSNNRYMIVNKLQWSWIIYKNILEKKQYFVF
jgi:hypothetical protein